MGDEQRDRRKEGGAENPQDERAGGYGSPKERKEEMEREGEGTAKEPKDRDREPRG